jgi:wyosine [tRNA(Phe)-imidazoG37] synthetase (radical SAM superfamily)
MHQAEARSRERASNEYSTEERMSVLPLQDDVVYGPIHSRRLGRSLGINLLPTKRKLCTFDCIYCQYGSFDPAAVAEAYEGFPSPETVLRRIEETLQQRLPLEYITFSGNGEPTLHPQFPDIVAQVLRLRDEMCPGVRLAILSNSSRVHRADIREAIEHLDDPIMKLDAGDPATFARVNRPGPGVTLEKILAGLSAMPRLVIQSLIIDGEVQNVRGEAHEAWLSMLSRLSPAKVQIYSTERPVAAEGIETVSREALEELARSSQERTGIEMRAY